MKKIKNISTQLKTIQIYQKWNVDWKQKFKNENPCEMGTKCGGHQLN